MMVPRSQALKLREPSWALHSFMNAIWSDNSAGPTSQLPFHVAQLGMPLTL